MKQTIYKAFNREQAKYQGIDWSPDPSRDGYVFGPAASGRYCHVASCQTLDDAVRLAKKYNDKKL